MLASSRCRQPADPSTGGVVMPIQFKKIEPKKDPFAKIAGTALAGAITMLGLAGREAQRRLSNYPPAQTSYRRTGTLGRRWTIQGPRPRGNDIVVSVGNNTKYAPNVEGPITKGTVRQKQRFADLGWPNVETVANEVIAEFRPLIEAKLTGK